MYISPYRPIAPARWASGSAEDVAVLSRQKALGRTSSRQSARVMPPSPGVAFFSAATGQARLESAGLPSDSRFFSPAASASRRSCKMPGGT